MNFETVEKIANAVLYEGYMLYPYRPSSTKNRQRWNFGTLYPQTFAQAQRPAEPFSLTAECLVEACREATLNIRVRFLHLDVTQPKQAGWVEGVERDAEVERKIGDLIEQPNRVELQLGPLMGEITLSAKLLRDGLVKLTAQLVNVSPAECTSLQEAVPFAFTSAHLLLGIDGGRFVSMLDPPSQYAQEIRECHNVGVYPVLAGEERSFDKMVCSPIILYDYPQVAPESAGDFFDGTEMDEMLALRVLTLTDEEKEEMRRGDSYARAILERT